MSETSHLFPDGDVGDSEQIPLSSSGAADGSSSMVSSTMDQLKASHQHSRHKTACFFHCFFRFSALLWYFISSIVLENFIAGFVICVLLLAFDFWTVKNVTGRLLVGLRWWNEVKEDGTNVWVFESKPDQREVNQSDSFLFWTTLYATPFVWGIIGLAAVLTFQVRNLLIVAVALMLAVANVIGYWRCQRDATSNARSRIQNFILSRI